MYDAAKLFVVSRGCRTNAIDYLCRNSRVWNEKIRKLLRDDYRNGRLVRVEFDGGKFEFYFASFLPRSRVVDVSAQQPVTFLTLKNTTTVISDKRQKLVKMVWSLGEVKR